MATDAAARVGIWDWNAKTGQVTWSEHVDRLLGLAATDKSKILRAEIYLADIGDFQAMNEVWEKWVAPMHTPARATIQAALANPEWKIEILVTAAV